MGIGDGSRWVGSGSIWKHLVSMRFGTRSLLAHRCSLSTLRQCSGSCAGLSGSSVPARMGPGSWTSPLTRVWVFNVVTAVTNLPADQPTR
jgi:hypothetical protein